MRLDQFIFRFSKLQDGIGAKLFRYILEWLYEDTSTMSIRDILNRLERLNLIDDVERNTVSHNYPLGTKEVVDSLNELIRQVETIKNIYSRLKEVYQSK